VEDFILRLAAPLGKRKKQIRKFTSKTLLSIPEGMKRIVAIDLEEDFSKLSADESGAILR
jgi:hypothetical protein